MPSKSLWRVPCAAMMLCLVACASGGGEGETTAAMPLLFRLSRTDASPKSVLYVWETGYWELQSSEACEVVKGTLTQMEVRTLQEYVDRVSSSHTTSGEVDCTDFAFEMFARSRFVCWGSNDDAAAGQAEAAAAELADFFDERFAELRSDGSMRNCTKTTPPGLPSSPTR